MSRATSDSLRGGSGGRSEPSFPARPPPPLPERPPPAPERLPLPNARLPEEPKAPDEEPPDEPRRRRLPGEPRSWSSEPSSPPGESSCAGRGGIASQPRPDLAPRRPAMPQLRSATNLVSGSRVDDDTRPETRPDIGRGSK